MKSDGVPEISKDKFIELRRYDTRAQMELYTSELVSVARKFGSYAMPEYLRTPYVFYEESVRNLVKPQDDVLELGAGSGLHTWALVETGARVTATDISPNSLTLLERHIVKSGREVRTQVADMESLPFVDNSFDVVVCVGSLSYGESALVGAEIKRVLRRGGSLICVDSLNHNPIYRLNRWLHYLRGARTRSTLRRMPDLASINAISIGFTTVDTHYFGCVTFAMPAVAWLAGSMRAQAVSDYFDRLFSVRRSAFKFVLVAGGLQK